MYEPTEFMWYEGERETWGHDQNIRISAVKGHVKEEDVVPYEIIEFPGGTFLVATGDESNREDLNENAKSISWILSWFYVYMKVGD